MESHGAGQRVTFRVLQTRLITSLNIRVRNGEFSERGLARFIGVSQPQIHNVLKGTRKLAPELADRLLAKLEISLLDLMEPLELREQVLRRRIPCGKCSADVAGFTAIRPKEPTALRKPLDRNSRIPFPDRKQAS